MTVAGPTQGSLWGTAGSNRHRDRPAIESIPTTMLVLKGLNPIAFGASTENKIWMDHARYLRLNMKGVLRPDEIPFGRKKDQKIMHLMGRPSFGYRSVKPVARGKNNRKSRPVIVKRSVTGLLDRGSNPFWGKASNKRNSSGFMSL